tara:strand:- start:2189 stop:2515 length:327 start_codon:yes stop_codon:yes gene_type:complete
LNKNYLLKENNMAWTTRTLVQTRPNTGVAFFTASDAVKSGIDTLRQAGKCTTLSETESDDALQKTSIITFYETEDWIEFSSNSLNIESANARHVYCEANGITYTMNDS